MAYIQVLLICSHLTAKWLILTAIRFSLFVGTQHTFLFLYAPVHLTGPVYILLCYNYFWIQDRKPVLGEPRQGTNNNGKVSMEAIYVKTVELSGAQECLKSKQR